MLWVADHIVLRLGLVEDHDNVAVAVGSGRSALLVGREPWSGTGDLREVRPNHGDPNQWYESQDALDETVPTIEELDTEHEQQKEPPPGRE